MRFKAFQLGTLIGLLCVAACGAGAQAGRVHAMRGGIPHSLFEGREWRIAQYYVGGELLGRSPELVRRPGPYISFSGGVVQGFSGVWIVQWYLPQNR